MAITQNGSLKRDDNDYPVMGGTSSSDNATIINSSFDPVTRRLLTSDSGGGGTGTVTTVSVVSANGLAGSVANPTTTPAITLSTTVTGVLKGNGTAISAASPSTDYAALAFKTIAVSGQSDVVADSPIDTLTLVAGTNVTITTDATTDTITINSTGGGSGTPGGLNTQLQYNNAGSFGGITGATTNGTAVSLDSAHLLNPTINGAGVGLATLVYPNTASNATITVPATTGTLALTSQLTSGTVTSVASADGSITVTNPSTTVDLAVVKAPILTTSRTIGTITGDATSAGSAFNGSANNTNALTLATVNSNVGSFGSATAAPSFTVNGKGLITAAGTNTITPAVGSITGLGTGIATFLATPSSANLAAAITDETGSGALVFGTSPTLTTAVLGSSTATTQSPSDNSTKVATTAYVDAAILGQNFKEAAKYATTAALATVVYSNGSSGVGATLTAVGVGALSLDGNTPSVNDRILVKNQVSTFQNGIYTVTVVGTGATVFVLTRSTDANSTGEFKTGDFIFVTSGTANANTTWAYTGIDSPVIGTDAITYAQSSGQGTVTSGNGITVTGLSVAIDTSVTVDKTTVQTLTNKTLTSPTLTTPVINGTSTGTGVATAGTANTLALRDANGNLTTPNYLQGYSTTVTAAGTTVLTVASNYLQFFTGTSTQTVTLPVVATLVLGQSFYIANNSTGAVTVNASGGTPLIVLAGGTTALVTTILLTGTSALSWSVYYNSVLGTTGKSLSFSNTLTLAGTDGTTMTFPTTSKTIAANDGSNWTFASQAIGDIVTASSTTAYTRIAAVALGAVLTSAGTTTQPTWSTAPQITTIELGNASDTTLSRSAGGVLAVEGVAVPTISSTSTLTNKRMTRRVVTVNAPGGSPTTNTDNVDIQIFTGLAAAITTMTTNLSGTPVNGDMVEFQFVDNGTARAITWGTSFVNGGLVSLPTTTVINTLLRVLVEWQTTTSTAPVTSTNKWVCIAVA